MIVSVKISQLLIEKARIAEFKVFSSHFDIYIAYSWKTSAHLSEAPRTVCDSFKIFGMLGSIGL